MARSVLRVPTSHQPALAKLFELPDERVDALASALAACEPALSIRDLADRVAVKAALDPAIAYSIVRALASLYTIRDRRGIPLADFIADLLRAAKETGKPTLDVSTSDQPRIEARLTRLLSGPGALGITARAGDVLSEHDRVFCEARIVSDLRPVFSSDVRAAPEALIVVHNLRISTHKGDSYETIEIALDSGDVDRLRQVIERAVSKEASLKALAERGGIPVLAARSHDH